jgi:hypothetical protein
LMKGGQVRVCSNKEATFEFKYLFKILFWFRSYFHPAGIIFQNFFF